MAELYTVRFKRKQIITTYVGKGKTLTKTQREELIDVVHADMPLAAVVKYRETLPETAMLTYERQDQTIGKRDRVTVSGERHRGARRYDSRGVGNSTKPVGRSVEKPKGGKPEAAPASSGYADVINSMMESK